MNQPTEAAVGTAHPGDGLNDALHAAGAAILTLTDDGELTGTEYALRLVTGSDDPEPVRLSDLVGDEQWDAAQVSVPVETPDGRSVELRRASPGTIVAVDVTDHVERTRRSRTALRRYEALLERSSDVLALIGPDGAIQWASSSMQDLHGVSAADAVGQSGFAFVHPDDQARLIDELTWRAQTPGEHRPLTYRAAHADGTWRVLQMRSTNALADPDVNALVVVLKDVTVAVANHRLDAEIATLLRRHAAHVDPVTLIHQLADIGSHYIQVRRPEAFAGIRVNAENAIAATVGGTRPDLRPRRVFYLSGMPELTEDELAMFSRLAAVARLLINSAAERRTLDDLDARLNSLFLNNPMASAIMDVKGNMMRVNKAMEELVGVPADQIVGRSWRDLIHPDSEAMPPGPLPAVDPTVTSIRHVARWQLPDGRDRQVLVFLVAVFDSTGKLTHFGTQYLDITDQEKLLADLTAMNRQLAENLELTGTERDQLTTLVSALADEHERERATLATRLTEEAVQRLVGTRFALGSLGAGTDHPEVNEVNDLLGGVIDELRTTASGMRPPTLDLFGLEPAVRQIATSLAGSGRIVQTNVEEIPRLGSSEEILLYRAIAAAANTASRPGVASVELNLTVSGDEVLVVVRDDGPPVQPTPADALALGAMRSQVAARGGTMMAGPRRDHGPGLELVCALPLTAAVADEDADDQH